MKTKKIVFILLIAGLFFMTTDTFAQVTKLKTMGRYPFARVKGTVPTPEVMKMLFDRYAADIKMGFDMAGYGDLYLPFLDQLKAATFTDTTLAVGDRVSGCSFETGRKSR